MSEPILLDFSGRRITSVEIERAKRFNIAAGCLGTIWFAMTFNMPLTLFMEAIGAGGFLIGMITAIRQLVMVVQIPAAFLSERIASRRKFWAVLALVHRSVWFAIAAVAFSWKPEARWVPVAVLALMGTSDLLGNAGAAAWFSWMADLIPARTAGSFWGRRQAIITAASLAGMGVAGFILDQFRAPQNGATNPRGFALVFGLAAMCGVADIVVHLWVAEPQSAPRAEEQGILPRLLAPIRDRDFRHLTLAMGFWTMGYWMFTSFSLVYLKRFFPVSYSDVAAVTIATSLGTVFTGSAFGTLVDRLGARVLSAILMIAAPITALSWFFINTSFVTFHLPWIGLWRVPQALLWTVPSSFFAGAAFSGMTPCQLRLLAALSNSKGRTMAMAVHWSAIGVIGVSGALLGGWIMDRFVKHPTHLMLPTGTPFGFFHVIIAVFAFLFWGLATPLILSIRTRVDKVPFTEALARMLAMNPLNALRNFFNLQTFMTPSTVRKRAQAARSLGVFKSGMAVPDLIRQLDDPALEVREEAIEALGAIGSDEAVDALLAKLEDPQFDLVPRVCRALRTCGDARCMDALARQLAGTDRETLCESARTLGRIGDRRALPHLLTVVTHSRDGRVLASACEALAALGEVSAAYQIIPQIRALPNKMLKRAMTLAVADLLGERDSFYPILLEEMEVQGAGSGRLVHDLVRAVKKQFPAAAPQLAMLAELETACHEERASRCAELLLNIGLHLVQFRHKLPLTLDPNRAMSQLLERDPRSAIGVWYLKILNEPWCEATGGDRRAPGDVLLGLHIVLAFLGNGAE